MGWARPKQRFQDWFTQQWVILWGRKIDPDKFGWLLGPFGDLNGIGEGFIRQLAASEDLIIEKNGKSKGLIQSVDMLDLPQSDRSRLSARVIHFYEHTSDYDLDVIVEWNPLFKCLGALVNRLFSQRINQLNMPMENDRRLKSLTSEIITLTDAKSGETKHTAWLRTSKADDSVMYSGIYGTCRLPTGKTCIKAVFPLPQGNASVIMVPRVGDNGELILESTGRKIGDAGFYFLLKDAKGNFWAQFIPSFRDRLVVTAADDRVDAEQILTLWGRKVVLLRYRITLKNTDAKSHSPCPC